jgi:hypothetical protein
MTKARVPLVVAALVAAFLFTEYVVVAVVNFALLVFGPSQPISGQIPAFLMSYAGGALAALSEIVFFSVGVFVSLRFVSRPSVDDGWKRTILRGVIGTLLGVAAVIVVGLVEAAVNSSTISPYPFAYSFGYRLESASFASRLPQAFELGLDPLFSWLVPVVLAVVLLRVWLGRQSRAEFTAPVSAAEKSVAR